MKLFFDDDKVDKILEGLREPTWKIPVGAYAMISTAEKMNELLSKGWALNFTDGSLNAIIGDCNCPYEKDYDPKDGHGFTDVEYTGNTIEGLIEQVWKKHCELFKDGEEQVWKKHCELFKNGEK